MQQTGAEQRGGRLSVRTSLVENIKKNQYHLAFLEIQVLYPFQYMLILSNFPKNVASIRNRYYPCHSFIDEEIEVHKQK